MAHLELRHLSIAFKKERVLDGLSLSLEEGETVSIIGPSGCGKTVLLRLIAGIHTADAGAVYLAGERIDGLLPEQRDLGMAFQNFALYPHLSAFENIASPLRARGLPAGEVEARVQEVASLLRIDHVLGHLPKALSNGQKQRCSLCRSLAPKPGLLLLDDPLRNVDAKLRYEMRLELPGVLRQAGTTVLYVTQDYKEAMALGDRVAVLLDGRIAQVAPPAEVYRRPASREVARLFGDPTINLIPASVEGGRARVLGTSVPVAAEGPIQIGVRPEDVEVAMEPGEGAVPVELDAVTPLNVRAILLLKTAEGQELLANLTEDEAARFPRGHRQVWARVRPERLLAFAAEGGQRLTMPDGAA